MTSGIALLAALVLPLPGFALVTETGAPEASASLDVQAAPGCTSRGDITARVASRSSRIHFVEGDATHSVEATFAAGPSGGVAVGLVVTGPGGKAMSRRFLARSCAEAADAAALIVAVTLDPASATDGRTTTAGTASPLSSGDSSASAPSATSSTPGPAPATGGKPVERAPDSEKRKAPPAAPADVVSVAPPPVPSRRQAAVRLAGQTIFGPAPAVMPGIGIYAMAALDRDALWSPAIVLGAIRAWRSGLVETGGTASFTLDAVSLDACLLRARLSLLEGRACASGLLGRLVASGTDTVRGASVPRPFAAVGAAALVSASIGWRLELSARLGVGATVLRDFYEFGTDVFHRAARLTIDASLGLGVRWP